MEFFGSVLKYAKERGFKPHWQWQAGAWENKPNSYVFWVTLDERRITDDETNRKKNRTTNANRIGIKMRFFMPKQRLDNDAVEFYNGIQERVREKNHVLSIRKSDNPLEPMEIELHVNTGLPKTGALQTALDQLDATEVYKLTNLKARVTAARRIHDLLMPKT